MLVVKVLLDQDVLPEQHFEDLSGLNSHVSHALKLLLDLGPLVGQVSLLFVAVLEGLPHGAHLTL